MTTTSEADAPLPRESRGRTVIGIVVSVVAGEEALAGEWSVAKPIDAEELTDAVGSAILAGRARVLVVGRSSMREVVGQMLERRGIDFVVDEGQAAQLGQGRERGADDAVDLELRVVEGPEAIEPDAGWQRVAFVDGLGEGDRQALDDLVAREAAGDRLSPSEQDRLTRLRVALHFETVAVLVRDP